MLRDIVQNTAVKFFAADRSLLAGLPRQRPGTTDTGWYRRNMFMQHLAERVIADGLERYPYVAIQGASEVIGMDLGKDRVRLTARDPASGAERSLTASYSVGADSARSTVRKLVDLPWKARPTRSPG